MLTIYADDTEITKNIGDVSRKNSIYKLATIVSFETLTTDNAYLKALIYTLTIGEVTRIVTNVEMFCGIIVSVDNGNKTKNKYTDVNMGWHMNTTSQTYQFRDITVNGAIHKICADLSIMIDNICDLSVMVTQIYFDKYVSNIIKDLLSKCSDDYNNDFTPTGLHIYKVGTLVAYPEFRVANNLAQKYFANSP